MLTPSDYLSRQRWLASKNMAGADIPGYAVLYANGISSDNLISVIQYPGYLTLDLVVFNAPVTLPTGDKGACTGDFPAWGLYDDADGTPAAGELWGPLSGSYKLRKGQPGFHVVGLIDATQHIVEVIPADSLAVWTWGRVDAITPGPPDPVDWTEQRPTAGGGFEDLPGGIVGVAGNDTAYEVNNTTIAVGSIVQLWRTGIVAGTGFEWRYVQCCPAP